MKIKYVSYLPVIEKWKSFLIFFNIKMLSKSSELHFISTLQVSLFFSTSNVKFQFNDLSEIFEDNCFRSEFYIWQQAILLIDALGFEPDIQADVKDFSLIYSDSGNFSKQTTSIIHHTPTSLQCFLFPWPSIFLTGFSGTDMSCKDFFFYSIHRQLTL